jgi:hypothetical protein
VITGDAGDLHGIRVRGVLMRPPIVVHVIPFDLMRGSRAPEDEIRRKLDCLMHRYLLLLNC